MSISTLPDEVTLHIFSSLSFWDLQAAGRTCRHWNSLSKEDSLYHKIAQRDVIHAEVWSEPDRLRIYEQCSYDEYCPAREEVLMAACLGMLSLQNATKCYPLFGFMIKESEKRNV